LDEKMLILAIAFINGNLMIDVTVFVVVVTYIAAM